MNLNSTVKLYHFTALTHLPAILREGILRGEVPVTPYTSITTLNAPNLTTNPNPADQKCWCGGILNKTKVRLTVEMPNDKLTSFRQIKEKYKMKSRWVKLLDPSYERRHWFFTFGGVSVQQITKIEIFDDGAYREFTSEELRVLLARIEEEREKVFRFHLVTSGRRAGHIDFEFKDGHHDSWLLDGELWLTRHRADA
jgi:hypothetical protein